MPAAKIELLQRFLGQGGGQLSKRARTKEFAALTESEIEAVERIYADTFGASDSDIASLE